MLIYMLIYKKSNSHISKMKPLQFPTLQSAMLLSLFATNT